MEASHHDGIIIAVGFYGDVSLAGTALLPVRQILVVTRSMAEPWVMCPGAGAPGLSASLVVCVKQGYDHGCGTARPFGLMFGQAVLESSMVMDSRLG